MKKVLLLIICSMILFATASCKTAAPLTAKEEIVLHEWSIAGSFGKEQGVLSFAEGKVSIHAKMSDETFRFSDECIIDDRSITINTEDYGIITIKYALSGEILELEYFGKKITLKKK